MDFAFTAEDEHFRSEVRSFLTAELPEWFRGYAHSDVAFEVVKDVTQKMADQGWLTMAWPKEYGGQESSIWQQVVFKEEMTLHYEPRGPGYMALNWIGPSIMMYGTEEQKKEHLGRIARGEGYWCQGFSEPDAGSDLASLKTRAVRDGDEYVINGEKIWTSHVLRGEWIFLLARTDPDAPKHKGISAFLVPLNLPGIRRVPITSMAGTYGRVGHIFFEDVRVATGRLGPENEGWRVAMDALRYERAGNPRWLGSMMRLAALKEYAMGAQSNGTRLFDQPWVRQRFAQLVAEAEVARLLYYRNVSADASGTDTSSIGPIARLSSTISNQNVSRFAMELLGGLADVVDAPDDGWVPLGGSAGETWMEGTVATVVAGSLEVNKNQLATRGLGLPR